jgi:XTP/dITP diphosphohydrolase
MQKILIASKNKHKVTEFAALIPPSIEVFSLLDFPEYPDIAETGNSFLENAFIKAKAGFQYTGLPTMADDSGLEVFALDNRPGIYSARYSGENASSEENNKKLLVELTGIADRRARFICQIAFVSGNEEFDCEGILNGTIALSASGTTGFGYDPLFIPEGYHQSLASLGSDAKNEISHRAIATEKFISFLNQKIKNH